MPFTACRYFYPVQRYLWSNSKVVVKRTKFWTFLASPILRGRCLAARHVAKFHEATPFGSKVLAANTLHFKAIFDPPLKKVVRGAAIPDGGCASKT